MSAGPLTGVKVVEIAGLGPAPCAGMMLADMGAEVILVERKNSPDKSDVRAEEKNTKKEQSAIYNRGKKSIALDLKNPASVSLVLQLVEKADILIEGFRPGVMERLGLGPDVCLDRNPKLVYGRMTGWGQYGPLAHAAGHDPNYIAISGALWFGGGRNQKPSAPLTLVGDLGGGAMMLLWGVICAYVHAQKNGEGQVIDAAMTDGSAYLSTLLWSAFHGGRLSNRLGVNWQDRAAPWNDTYICADEKYITICAVEPQFYQLLMQLLGLEGNPVFADQWEKSNWPQGKLELKELFRKRSRDEWCDILEGTDVCFGPVLDFEEALVHPHNVDRETFVEINGVTQPAPAPKFSQTRPRPGMPPKKSEHAEVVLRELGLTREEILELAANEVF